MSAEQRRPFRHLCPEADMRDAMTDDEFWAHVAKNLGLNTDPDDTYWDGPDADVQMARPACSVCGELGACGWDAEGRALIHTTDDEEPDDA